ncbi:hypothetical protein RRG08_020476 [Elysia crispata]|uniref:Uncharacterized protein n=1 Tax=Elysia crispata TaxID=231223 RepID=A0AAE1ABZ3_9GAST|nr:hypothetical protein RRG08_020476 [Elysia crispata]
MPRLELDGPVASRVGHWFHRPPHNSNLRVSSRYTKLEIENCLGRESQQTSVSSGYRADASVTRVKPESGVSWSKGGYPRQAQSINDE